MLAATRLGALVLIAIAIPAMAYGQNYRGHSQTPSQVPRYTPQSPTVSPYLSLLNRNNGPVTNYYGLVRPLERQQSFNLSQSQTTANQNQIIQSQEQQINKLKDEQQAFSQPKVKPTGTAGWFQNTGQSTASFGVESHFYGQWQGTKKGAHRGSSAAASARHF